MAETPLHQAADYSQAPMAALLLSHGADPNKQQGDGDTPLHHAAFRGDARMVGLLLSAKADPNVRNFMFGRTPLHYAVDCGHADCVRLLLAAGGDVRLIDKYGKSIWDMVKTEALKAILLKGETDTEGPTLPTKAEFMGEESGNSSYRSFGQVLHGLGSPTSSLLESVSGTVLEKRSSAFTSPPESVSSPTLKLQERVSSVRQSQRDWGDNTVLQDWLEKRHLGEIYMLLVASGFEDVETIIAQPKSWSQEDLLHIGIAKPGHRMRLLMALDEESGLFARPPVVRFLPASKSNIRCCGTQLNPTNSFNLALSHPLRDWLRAIKLEHLFDRFQASGFDDLNDLVHMMSWRLPITDEVLERDIGITKPGHRARILSRLQEGCKPGQDPSFDPAINPDTACSTCLCM